MATVDDLFAEYHNVLQDIADRVAPQHSLRRRVGRMAPWFDDRCRQARRECRRLERRYRRSRTADDRGRWIEAVRRKFRLYKSTKEAYWQSGSIACCARPFTCRPLAFTVICSGPGS